MRELKTYNALQAENQELEHDVQRLREQVRAAEEKAAIAQKASRDAWQFAKLAFKSSPRT